MKFGLHTVTNWFGIIMILAVTSGAVILTFTDAMSDRLFGAKRIGFICVLLAYAVYRGFRVYQTIKYSKSDE
jgi:hypothetical protein